MQLKTSQEGEDPENCSTMSDRKLQMDSGFCDISQSGFLNICSEMSRHKTQNGLGFLWNHLDCIVKCREPEEISRGKKVKISHKIPFEEVSEDLGQSSMKWHLEVNIALRLILTVPRCPRRFLAQSCCSCCLSPYPGGTLSRCTWGLAEFSGIWNENVI